MGTVGLPPLPPLDPPSRGPAGDGDDAGPAPLRDRLRARVAALRAGAVWWELPAATLLTVATLLLYTWQLAREGWANTYYAAAVQAGADSWSAFFFGALDAEGFITVDKPPLSLWPAALAARVFGVNSWSILLPQAIAGVLTVLLLYRMVRRHFGPAAGLLAGAAMALTPVAALMFRYNNPDALLTLLLVCAAYAFMRALEGGRTAWLVAAGALVGAAFMTKSLQAFLVLPAFAVVWMTAAPGGWGRRAAQALAGVAALIVAGGWWVLVVELIPESARPYIGGSEGNSALELILGYNGLDRISGGGGPGAGTGFSGAAGFGRLFNDQLGGQIAWLLPAAALALALGLWVTRSRPRTDMRRAMYLLWGGWALTHAVVFSAMTGIIHPYYTVAMAPAVAALVGVGAAQMWGMRGSASMRWLAPAAIVATALTAHALLERTPDFAPWLRWAVVAGAVVAAAALLVDPRRLPRAVVAAVATLGVVAALAGPAAYALDTASAAHSGGNPTAGPSVAGGGGGPGGFGGQGGPGGGRGGDGGGMPGGGSGGAAPRGGQGGMAPGAGGPPQAPSGGGTRGTRGTSGGAGGGAADAGLAAFLTRNGGSARWAAATTSAGTAGPLQLATGLPVMALGGFSGGDDAITLEEFTELVRRGEVRYYIGAGGGGFGGGGGLGGRSSLGEIAEWVQANGTAVDTSLTGGATVYDLSAAAE